ncbi:MerR family transcriptional regulator [Thiomicrorhabdus sp. ZW0627]|uniref:MerR family transcriptional regulator n=1 Tax=Thiomicrorhabdus sp. ZW0627 TaxID=3039774 RepID=UPI002436E812|nr:MerR family transcriptional regulator [Thiomicrorhabdus sp. ZW0627]MDG6773817.1 MerR family transcriptional regulator [Thiomicrorhabdus sp. ZW0627]
MKSEPLYPIREVSRLTGVNSITLRAWERRYKLIDPVRTPSGHRLYTQAHIERINAAVKLTEQGVPISRVKNLLEKATASQTALMSVEDNDASALLLQKARDYDPVGLKQALDFLFSDLPEDLALETIRAVTLELSEESSELEAFWTAMILPRLYSKLRFLTRVQKTYAMRRFWLQPANDKPMEVTLLLVAIWLARQGIYPIVHLHSQSSDAFSFEMLVKLHCQGLALVDDSGNFDEQAWSSKIEQYPKLELHCFTQRSGPMKTDEAIHAEYHDLEALF